MNHASPDFYLASSEGYDMEEPRQCWRIKRVATEKRDDLLLVKISPPLIGQKFGLGDKDIDQVFVAPRHVGASLFPINEWPLFVHVARPLIDEPENYCKIRQCDIESIAWAELYETQEDARAKKM
jgi:hypothetical protein